MLNFVHSQENKHSNKKPQKVVEISKPRCHNLTGIQIKVHTGKLFCSYFSIKKYVVGTKKNHFNLLSTH